MSDVLSYFNDSVLLTAFVALAVTTLLIPLLNIVHDKHEPDYKMHPVALFIQDLLCLLTVVAFGIIFVYALFTT